MNQIRFSRLNPIGLAVITIALVAGCTGTEQTSSHEPRVPNVPPTTRGTDNPSAASSPLKPASGVPQAPKK